jgi:hypothetical protein
LTNQLLLCYFFGTPTAGLHHCRFRVDVSVTASNLGHLSQHSHLFTHALFPIFSDPSINIIVVIVTIVVRYFRMGAIYSTSFGRPTEAQFGQTSSSPDATDETAARTNPDVGSSDMMTS